MASRPNKKDSSLRYLIDHFVNKTTDGAIDKQTSAFQISYQKIFSETHKKAVIQILEFPTFIYPGHLEGLRLKLLESLPPTERELVDLIIVEYDEPNYSFNKGKAMARKEKSVNMSYRTKVNKYNMAQEAIENGTAPSSITPQFMQNQYEDIMRYRRLKESFKYCREHMASGGTYLSSYIFLELTAPTPELLEVITQRTEGLLAKGIEIEGVSSPYVFQLITELEDYVKRFGVGSLRQPVDKKKDKMYSMSLTSDIGTSDEAFNTGIVRTKRPHVYMGHRVDNNYPYHGTFTSSTDAHNLLLVADSGSGKTTQVKTMALWILHDTEQRLIINDIKGNEWNEFAKFRKDSAILNFNAANPSFINTYIIPDYKLLGYDNPRNAFQLASQATAQILATLVDAPEEAKSRIDIICSSIVNTVYLKHGVNPAEFFTYENSQNINFADHTWAVIDDIATGKDARDFREDDLLLVKNALYHYLCIHGAKYAMFTSNEISIPSLLEKGLLIINYGTQTAGGSTTRLEKEYKCWMIQKYFATDTYVQYSYLNNLFVTEIQEEVAQIFTDSALCDYLCRQITGNRSQGKTNILLTNTLEPLLNPTVNVPQMNALKANINMFMLGKCKHEVARDFVQYLGEPDLLESALSVAKQIKPELKKAFLIYNQDYEIPGTHIVKSILPDEILDTVMKSRAISKKGVLNMSN